MNGELFGTYIDSFGDRCVFPPKFRSSRVILVIETVTCEGRGTDEAPSWKMKTYTDLDGNILAQTRPGVE
uniref:Uncharacterized protein n=1 Tax=viral metagenome TaxID=1070528 RepID=A0A6M3JDZ2_9ZZZZ